MSLGVVYKEQYGEGRLEIRQETEGPASWSIWRVDRDGTEEEVMEGFRDLEYCIKALREAAYAIQSILGYGGTGLTGNESHLPVPKVHKKTA